MSTAEEKAWASALATKYGIREPVAPFDRVQEFIADRVIPIAMSLGTLQCPWSTTVGSTPATTATAS